MEKKTKKLISTKALAILGIMGVLIACGSGCATIQKEANSLEFKTKRYGVGGTAQWLQGLPFRTFGPTQIGL